MVSQAGMQLAPPTLPPTEGASDAPNALGSGLLLVSLPVLPCAGLEITAALPCCGPVTTL